MFLAVGDMIDDNLNYQHELHFQSLRADSITSIVF